MQDSGGSHNRNVHPLSVLLLIRYGLVGFVSMAINIVVFALTVTWVDVVPAQIVAFCISGSLGGDLIHRFVFARQLQSPTYVRWLKNLVHYCPQLLINIVGVWVLIQFGASPVIAQVFTFPLAISSTFFIFRWFH